MYVPVDDDQIPSPFVPVIRRLTSVYYGFFSGGARNVHTDIIHALQDQGVTHRVIGYYDSVNRGSEGIQHKEQDSNYQKLHRSGVELDTLGLTHYNTINLNRRIETFSGTENPHDPFEILVRDLAIKLAIDDSDAVLSLKEQPANLLVHANRYLVEVMGLSPKPVFITLHRTDPEIQDRESIQTLKDLEHNPHTKQYITGYIACAESAMLAYQRALGLTEEKERFTFVPNGIDSATFRMRCSREVGASVDRLFADRTHPPSVDTPIVTIGARNSVEKDIGLFLRAAHLLLSRHSKAHVVMCGSGMDSQGIEALAHHAAKTLCLPPHQSSKLQTRLHPLGRVTSADMSALLNITNVVALTSPTLGEADPLVLKEGMLCGAVPVTTCCGDAPSVIGIKNPREQMLKPIKKGFIIGSRGILTSHEPRDIVAAWRYAMARSEKFRTNIHFYGSRLSRHVMGEGYRERMATLLAEHPTHQVLGHHHVLTSEDSPKALVSFFASSQPQGM